MVGMDPRAGPSAGSQTEETEASTEPSCNAAAALITFVAIPGLIFAPVGITYLFVGEWWMSTLYAIIGICAAVASVVMLYAISLIGHAIWDTLGSPIAQACQARKDRWKDRRHARMPEAG